MPRLSGLPQGDPAAPAIFNIVLDSAATKFQTMAEKRDWGVQIGPVRMSILLFADNFWFMELFDSNILKRHFSQATPN